MTTLVDRLLCRLNGGDGIHKALVKGSLFSYVLIEDQRPPQSFEGTCSESSNDFHCGWCCPHCGVVVCYWCGKEKI